MRTTPALTEADIAAHLTEQRIGHAVADLGGRGSTAVVVDVVDTDGWYAGTWALTANDAWVLACWYPGDTWVNQQPPAGGYQMPLHKVAALVLTADAA